MLIIIKWRPSSILSKIEAGPFDLSMFLYLIGYIFDYDVINMKPQDHNVKVSDVIDDIDVTVYLWRHNQCFTHSWIFILCQLNWLRFAL